MIWILCKDSTSWPQINNDLKRGHGQSSYLFQNYCHQKIIKAKDQSQYLYNNINYKNNSRITPEEKNNQYLALFLIGQELCYNWRKTINNCLYLSLVQNCSNATILEFLLVRFLGPFVYKPMISVHRVLIIVLVKSTVCHYYYCLKVFNKNQWTVFYVLVKSRPVIL